VPEPATFAGMLAILAAAMVFGRRSQMP